ncbi:MAG: hypothetical protein GX605_05350 [Chloroflexi bacterium]|nr:hypothetical protein [Chloroflexota bacterium]
MGQEIAVPAEWLSLDPASLGRRIMVLGASDSGKSTFAGYLFQRVQADGRDAAFLDADLGQSTVGLPTTVNLAAPQGPLRLVQEGAPFPPRPGGSSFVGSVTPRGYLLPLLVGCAPPGVGGGPGCAGHRDRHRRVGGTRPGRAGPEAVEDRPAAA